MNPEPRQLRTQRWWLLTLRGVAIGGIGVPLLLMVLGIWPVPMGDALGGLLLAGVCAGWFGLVNQRTEQDGLWPMLNGLIGTGFGMAALVLAHQPMEKAVSFCWFFWWVRL